MTGGGSGALLAGGSRRAHSVASLPVNLLVIHSRRRSVGLGWTEEACSATAMDGPRDEEMLDAAGACKLWGGTAKFCRPGPSLRRARHTLNRCRRKPSVAPMSCCRRGLHPRSYPSAIQSTLRPPGTAPPPLPPPPPTCSRLPSRHRRCACGRGAAAAGHARGCVGGGGAQPAAL